MSFVTNEGRIAVKPPAAIPALPSCDLPEVNPSRDRASTASSVRNGLKLEEGCLVTRRVSCANQVAHIVNAVRGPKEGRQERTRQVITVLKKLAIAPFWRNITGLNSPHNLVLLEPGLHTSLDLYNMVAITPTLTTLRALITMVRTNNDYRQRMANNGTLLPRKLNFTADCFSNPEYELVILHKHFLPCKTSLPRFNVVTQTEEHFVITHQYLFHDNVRFPSFHHHALGRKFDGKPNVFFWALNAALKFQHYLDTHHLNPDIPTLPQEVLILMQCTIDLVEFLYWTPALSEGFHAGATTEDSDRMEVEDSDRMEEGREPKVDSPKVKVDVLKVDTPNVNDRLTLWLISTLIVKFLAWMMIRAVLRLISFIKRHLTKLEARLNELEQSL